MSAWTYDHTRKLYTSEIYGFKNELVRLGLCQGSNTMKKVLLLAAIFGMLCSPSQAKTWWNYEASCTVTDVRPTPALPFETAGYTIRIAFDARNPTKINNLQISPNADQTDFVDVLSREYSKLKYWK